MIEHMSDDDVNQLPPIDHPLFTLGNRLAHYLDDDKFNECEKLLLDGWSHDAIDRKTGQSWRENSSLEVWFPITHQNLVELLPGNHYMDPPDGGDVSVMDQLRRMAKDAERYRWLRDSELVEVYIATDENESGYGAWNVHDDKDCAIDAAMARDRDG